MMGSLYVYSRGPRSIDVLMLIVFAYNHYINAFTMVVRSQQEKRVILLLSGRNEISVSLLLALNLAFVLQTGLQFLLRARASVGRFAVGS